MDRPANPEAVFTMFKAEMGDAAGGEDDTPEDAAAVEAARAAADIEIQAIAEISRLVKSNKMTSSEILRRVKAADVEKAWPDELNKVEARHREKIDQLEALHKTRIEQLEKSAEENLSKLAEIQSEKDSLAKRVAELEALPEPPRIRLMAISKAEDGDGFEPSVTPVLKGDGSIDEVATEIKKIQRLNGKRLWS